MLGERTETKRLEFSERKMWKSTNSDILYTDVPAFVDTFLL